MRHEVRQAFDFSTLHSPAANVGDACNSAHD
jgi:hypothetical protein